MKSGKSEVFPGSGLRERTKPAIADKWNLLVKLGIWPDMLLLSVLCVTLGVWGGTPFFHPDSVLPRALNAVSAGGNLHFYNYPGLVIYLLMIVYLLFYGALLLSGTVSTWAAFVSQQTPVDFSLPGHLLIVFFSIMGVLCTYKVVHRLTVSRGASLASGLFLCLSLQWVQNAHYLTVDLPLAALGILVVALIMRFTADRCQSSSISSATIGAAIGLATAAKYNGAALLAPSLIGLLYSNWRNKKQVLLCGFILLSSTAIVFTVANPFIFFDTAKFSADLSYEMQHSRLGHMGFDTDNAFLFFLSTVGTGYGFLPLALALVGLLLFVMDRSFSLGLKATLLLYPGILYLWMGSSKLAFQRYALPLLPFLAILSALAVWYAYRELRRRQPQHRNILLIGVSVLVLISVSTGAYYSLSHDYLLTKTDTRQDLQTVMSTVRLNDPGSDIVYSMFAGSYLLPYSTYAHAYPIYTGRSWYIALNPDLITSSRDIVLFDSFSNDHLLHTTRNYDLKVLYDGLEKYTVVSISPYTVRKDDVPYSPNSVYSPSLPDISYREKPGPYIEIYCKNSSTAELIISACEAQGIEYTVQSGYDGYYYRAFKSR